MLASSFLNRFYAPRIFGRQWYRSAWKSKETYCSMKNNHWFHDSKPMIFQLHGVNSKRFHFKLNGYKIKYEFVRPILRNKGNNTGKQVWNEFKTSSIRYYHSKSTNTRNMINKNMSFNSRDNKP